MNGFNIAEAGHVINILPPQSIGGGVEATSFSLRDAEHVTIIITFGKIGANAPTAITLTASSTATIGNTSPPGGSAIGFRYYQCTNASVGIDLSSPPVVAAAAGILQAVMQKINNSYIIIEVDAAEVDIVNDAPTPSWLTLNITDSGNNTFASAVAILSGVRNQYQASRTQLS